MYHNYKLAHARDERERGRERGRERERERERGGERERHRMSEGQRRGKRGERQNKDGPRKAATLTFPSHPAHRNTERHLKDVLNLDRCCFSFFQITPGIPCIPSPQDQYPVIAHKPPIKSITSNQPVQTRTSFGAFQGKQTRTTYSRPASLPKPTDSASARRSFKLYKIFGFEDTE